MVGGCTIAFCLLHYTPKTVLQTCIDGTCLPSFIHGESHMHAVLPIVYVREVLIKKVSWGMISNIANNTGCSSEARLLVNDIWILLILLC